MTKLLLRLAILVVALSIQIEGSDVAPCDSFVKDCVPRTGLEACGASWYRDYKPVENSVCDFSGTEASNDGICAKPSRTVDGKASLTCSPWDLVECSQNLDVSLGPRPVGSKCTMRRRRIASRVCMKYKDDGSPSMKLRCASESISSCYEKAEGDTCGTDLACHARSPQPALICSKLNEYACWDKSDGQSCSFKVYGNFTEASKCISSVCEEPDKAACFAKPEGSSCAGYVRIKKERVSLEHRRRRATYKNVYSRETMNGGSCNGALDSKRVCEGATVKHTDVLYDGGSVRIMTPGVLIALAWPWFLLDLLCTGSNAA